MFAKPHPPREVAGWYNSPDQRSATARRGDRPFIRCCLTACLPDGSRIALELRSERASGSGCGDSV